MIENLATFMRVVFFGGHGLFDSPWLSSASIIHVIVISSATILMIASLIWWYVGYTLAWYGEFSNIRQKNLYDNGLIDSDGTALGIVNIENIEDISNYDNVWYDSLNYFYVTKYVDLSPIRLLLYQHPLMPVIYLCGLIIYYAMSLVLMVVTKNDIMAICLGIALPLLILTNVVRRKKLRIYKVERKLEN